MPEGLEFGIEWSLESRLNAGVHSPGLRLRVSGSCRRSTIIGLQTKLNTPRTPDDFCGETKQKAKEAYGLLQFHLRSISVVSGLLAEVESSRRSRVKQDQMIRDTKTEGASARN